MVKRFAWRKRADGGTEVGTLTKIYSSVSLGGFLTTISQVRERVGKNHKTEAKGEGKKGNSLRCRVKGDKDWSV